MAEYRSGYGKSTFGSYNYGLDGSILVAASTIVTVSAVAAASTRVRLTASVVVGVATAPATVNRVQFGSASISIACSTVCNAIEKWEPEPNTPETWTPVDPATEIWQYAANASTSWTATPP